VLEIGFKGRPGEGDAERVRAALAPVNGQTTLDLAGGTLTVRALNVARMLPAILEALARIGLQPGEVHLRENTLEDVFIQLTGRRLRE